MLFRVKFIKSTDILKIKAIDSLENMEVSHVGQKFLGHFVDKKEHYLEGTSGNLDETQG